jgi:hypothetical protein
VLNRKCRRPAASITTAAAAAATTAAHSNSYAKGNSHQCAEFDTAKQVTNFKLQRISHICALIAVLLCMP